MRFLVDAQLPPALARWLGEQGLAAMPVRELGLRESDDGSIWSFALEGEWMVLTKDEDFVVRCIGNPGTCRRLAAQRQLHQSSAFQMADTISA